MTRIIAICLALAAGPSWALDLSLPNAVSVRQVANRAGQIRLPDAPWSPGSQPNVVSGAIDREILRVPTAQRTSFQLLSGLRKQLADAGYEEVFSCADAACGGFDFRFQLDILGEPDMHVDLGDYLYVLMRATREDLQPHTVALLASRSRASGFVHVTKVSEPGVSPPVPEPDTAEPEKTAPSDDLGERLIETGHAVLADLDFGSGSSELGPGPFASLARLADWLAENPGARVVLVGHTDSVGSLETNTALSRARAASVARYLTEQLGAEPAQIQSSGAGFLAPVASNLTEEGRALNRRVEVVLLALDG